MLKLAFDLSVLGAAQDSQTARTGIYRVVDEIARSLASNNEIDVSWTTSGNPQSYRDVRRLIRREPSLHRPMVAYHTAAKLSEIVAAPVERLGASHLYPLVKTLIPKVRKLQSWATFDERLLDPFDVFHSPFHALPTPLLRRPGGVGPARVLTVHDLIPIEFPHFFQPENVQNFHKILGSVEPRDWVVCDSHSTRDDLLKFRPDLIPERVRVIHLAANESFRPVTDPSRRLACRKRYGIPLSTRYLLSLCTQEPRKNLVSILAAFEKCRRTADGDLTLVLAGPRGWINDPTYNKLLSELGDRAILTGFIDERDLPTLLSDSLALLYPSLYEGFGLPPLEAMQCGTPVITSDNSSLPEVVGDAAIRIHALDIDALVDAIDRVSRDHELCDDLSRRGLEQSKKFSWARFSSEHRCLYQEIANGR